LNENSDLPKDVFEKEKEGDVDLNTVRAFGDFDIDESKWYSLFQQAMMQLPSVMKMLTNIKKPKKQELLEILDQNINFKITNLIY
jgi:hypothetical protein